jgi:hypothetical protein
MLSGLGKNTTSCDTLRAEQKEIVKILKSQYLDCSGFGVTPSLLNRGWWYLLPMFWAPTIV